MAFGLYLITQGVSVYSQQWRQQVSFELDATLNDKDHTLDGFGKIVYVNNSPDTLRFIWFHLWANAYKNDRTAYSEYLLANDRTDFYFSRKDQKGYINRLDFKVNGITAKTEDHPEHIDIVKLLLPVPIAPRSSAVITTPFHVQVPYNFSGNGYIKNRYQLAQWHPVPALYDTEGWHIRPFTYQDDISAAQEADYEVTLNLPAVYTLMAGKAERKDSSYNGGIQVVRWTEKNTRGFSWSAFKPEEISTPKVKGRPVKKMQTTDPFKNAGNNIIPRLFDTSKVKSLSILPAIGYNLYDGFMIGLVFHNYLSPQNRVRFVFSPLYATQSGKLNGIGRASYKIDLPKTVFSQLEAGATIARFSLNESIDDLPVKEYAGFLKVAPFVRLTLKENSTSSKINRYLQLRQFYIREQSLEYKDVINGTDTSLGVGLNAVNTHITQLKMVLQNKRKLYPYSGELNIERHKGFIRAAFTGNYYFNYANNRDGLQVRAFAGKLFYSNRSDLKSFFTRRNHLNLAGANGEEDYTYSNYFIGRNEFEGLGSQQIIIRDGAFKVRTDLLSDKVGKTDNWLAALNFTTGVPDNINPLSVLPFRIPLKIFADLGTYAEAWDRDADAERFLFDAGLQFSLLHETVNIYVPLIYSKVFRDYNKSYLGEKRFWKTVSFSIDLQRLAPRKYENKLMFP